MIVERRLPSGIKLGNWIARHYNCKPLEPLQQFTAEELARAMRQEAEASGALGDHFLERVAARLNTTVAAVRRR